MPACLYRLLAEFTAALCCRQMGTGGVLLQ